MPVDNKEDRYVEETEDPAPDALEAGIGAFFDDKVGEDESGKPAKGTAGKAGKAAKGRVGARAQADADEAESDESEEGEEEDEESDDDGADDDDDEEEAEGEEEGDESDDEDDEDEEEAEADDDEDADEGEGAEGEEEEEGGEGTDAFEAAAERHRLPTEFDDVLKGLPRKERAVARQAFSKRIREMEAGFSRAMQDARKYRTEEAKWRADRAFMEQHPADYIADLLEKSPKLLEQLNEEIDKRETAAYREGKQIKNEATRKKLEDDVSSKATDQDQRLARAEHVERYARRLCAREGVDYDLVIEEALYAAIVSSPTRDISDVDVRTLVERKAKAFRKVTGEKRRAQAREYVRDKVRARDEGRRRPTARDRGHAPAAGRQREPKDLREALTRAAARAGIPENG